MRYKVKNRCHWHGRFWEKDQVVEMTIDPPHHFVRVPDDVVVTTTLLKEKIDPMKPKNPNNVSSYSEAIMAQPEAPAGFASSLESTKPMTMRQLKRR